jgi:hypothetical protein
MAAQVLILYGTVQKFYIQFGLLVLGDNKWLKTEL